ncbi:hypothetical protein PGB90_009693 [Kerria lacca]
MYLKSICVVYLLVLTIKEIWKHGTLIESSKEFWIHKEINLEDLEKLPGRVRATWLKVCVHRAKPMKMSNYETNMTYHFTSKKILLVVTGSTDGIGRAYAKELAKRGMNVVLISRTYEKLEKVATEIEKEYGVKTKIIAIDFSRQNSTFEHIERELQNIPIGILVNNVGMNYPYPMYVTEVQPQFLQEMINVNIGATILMTRMILPQMQKRQKGAIVNVSSGSELQPLPLMTVYAATKIFIKSFTEALRFENQKYGITIQQLSPLFVSTKMNAFSHRLQKISLLVPDAEMYASSAINTLGVVNYSTGYWAHGIQYFFISIPPVWLRTITGGIMNQVFRKDYFSAEKKVSRSDENKTQKAFI